MSTSVRALRERMGTIADLRSASALLSWDQLTIMPIQGGAERAHQIKTVEQLAHQMLIDSETGRLLEQAEKDIAAGGGTEIETALVRVTRHDYDRASRVPGELIGEIAKAAADGYAVWTEARSNADYSAFLPALERNIELRMRYIDCFEPADSPYDVLVEDYEQGLTSAEITRIFESLKPRLHSLVERVVERQDVVSADMLHQPFPVEGQEALGRWTLDRLGFDAGSWRLDPTVHPFQQTIGVHDIRLTTRYNGQDFSDSLLSTIHEFGHGIYERQIDPQLSRSPLASGCSMTLHESQSRFWENLFGRSVEYASLLHP
ncbi:MAG: carboxypeptidase M32, partial [Thermomicrobiales bacterium]